MFNLKIIDGFGKVDFSTLDRPTWFYKSTQAAMAAASKDILKNRVKTNGAPIVAIVFDKYGTPLFRAEYTKEGAKWIYKWEECK
jgi:hypothetical protein